MGWSSPRRPCCLEDFVLLLHSGRRSRCVLLWQEAFRPRAGPAFPLSAFSTFQMWPGSSSGCCGLWCTIGLWSLLSRIGTQCTWKAPSGKIALSTAWTYGPTLPQNSLSLYHWGYPEPEYPQSTKACIWFAVALPNSTSWLPPDLSWSQIQHFFTSLAY